MSGTEQQDVRPGPALLRIEDLSVAFGRRGGRGGQQVLDAVSLEARSGEILGVIGETGSGKTTLARAVVGLSPVTGGRITVDGKDLTGLRGRALRDYRRAGTVQYLFQDPLRSLDPDLTVRDLVSEPLAVTGTGGREQRAERAAVALQQVGLDPALGDRLPGQLSGGQRQRVSLARAVVTRPRLLLADEPVSALDASNRNHVLRLFDRLRHELDVAVVIISHDLSSLAGIADRIAVLYRGRLVEQGPTTDVLSRPLHPYTALLTASAPSVRREHDLHPAQLRADGPAWTAESGGCVFAARCAFADDACREQPAAQARTGGREVACHHADDWRARLAEPALTH
jgi:oligopeptide/dipeptide ABC transporter ATP-binding protein